MNGRRTLLIFSCVLILIISALGCKMSAMQVEISQLKYELEKRDEYEAKLNRIINSNLKLMAKGGWEQAE